MSTLNLKGRGKPALSAGILAFCVYANTQGLSLAFPEADTEVRMREQVPSLEGDHTEDHKVREEAEEIVRGGMRGRLLLRATRLQPLFKAGSGKLCMQMVRQDHRISVATTQLCVKVATDGM